MKNHLKLCDSFFLVIFAAKIRRIVMTAVQMNTMNTELWKSIGAIADSEALMTRLTRYAKKTCKREERLSVDDEGRFFCKARSCRETTRQMFFKYRGT